MFVWIIGMYTSVPAHTNTHTHTYAHTKSPGPICVHASFVNTDISIYIICQYWQIDIYLYIHMYIHTYIHSIYTYDIYHLSILTYWYICIYTYVYTHTSAIEQAQGNSQRQKYHQHSTKRVLYSIERVLYSIKRVLYSIKRALDPFVYTFRVSIWCIYTFQRNRGGTRRGSRTGMLSICYQKSPIICQKSPIFYQ